MSFCCVLLSFIPDSFSFLVCRISLFIFGLNRFCNTSTTFRANIVVRFVPATAISLCIVCFMELDVMMFVCCILCFYTCALFDQTTVRTTFLILIVRFFISTSSHLMPIASPILHPVPSRNTKNGYQWKKNGFFAT